MRRGPFVDASGVALALPGPPRRIVSLVPSVTELLFSLGVGPAVVGCTTFCTEPPAGVLNTVRVGGTKTPRLELVRALRPDLILANIEENHREHVETLRGWGMAVHVSYPRTVAGGIQLVRELGEVTGAAERGAALADDLARRLAEVTARARGRGRPTRVFYPIWRHPYMTINRDTYVHDVLAACGGENVFADCELRYPEVTLDAVATAGPEVILLPDEPYRFREAHAADFTPYRDMPAVRNGRVRLVDGRLASWFGPRMAEAFTTLPALLQR
ncbi:MAG: cobalamin-binding protein [Candidatus Rokubacteria bacterium]|nr:cobalamin-binding protein [Candidatus Rokubacteria bacterium]